ncbi:hypothetical protein P4388_30400 [Bacillus thuringiensis]|nr:MULTISPECIES: LPD1 domain-containing protein [Bacillus cereus group]MCU4776556.1 hypothetical protein [Bacillus cereus]MCU4807711.1 hypothetical protein [Bacillus cereus]MCU4813649.1 hypothetical protein [Bacillus cereus]MCU5120730.1 hypothetical protein [Bacillus cereus]MCU5143738.1 hypothetical protein [Bacillus cereus]
MKNRWKIRWNVLSSESVCVLCDTTIKLDKKRSQNYWFTNHDMFVRAFEVYVESDLQDQEHRNDYLVCNMYPFVYPLGDYT